MTTLSKIIYFCPAFGAGDAKYEIDSISNVVGTLKEDANIDVEICPNWPSLMRLLQDSPDTNMLIVFRLDYLERENLMLDEVLSMLSVLTKFVTDKKKVDIAVVVPRPCDSDLFSKLKRNGVLGIIPGMRFFDKKHSINAYIELQQGRSHWPKIVVTKEIVKSSFALTDRQYEIFTLVAKRGLSNKKIAEILHINEDTVKAHVGAILRKYGVRNRTQLALANKTGIIA